MPLILFMILQVILAIGLIVTILLQSGKTPGLSSTLTGTADTFMSKNKGKALDKQLAKATKWIAIVFVLLTLALTLVS
ncbi:MAG: preprotein translocase subunit SecG [Oscillospiraceae bacterium]|nr:preprotein translocase subunit SecG [Oscillospiraceae bacterium]